MASTVEDGHILHTAAWAQNTNFLDGNNVNYAVAA